MLDAGPDILNHNTETVPRLYRLARSGGRYARTLELLDRSRSYAPKMATKSGIMLGLGEEWDEVVATRWPICAARAAPFSPSANTCGRPPRICPMARYYHPDEFRQLKEIALEMGFAHVESGPARAELLSRARTGGRIQGGGSALSRRTRAQGSGLEGASRSFPEYTRNIVVRATSVPAAARLDCAQIARDKRAAFRHDIYWGKPVPGFGDPDARVLILGPRARRARRQRHRPRLHW